MSQDVSINRLDWSYSAGGKLIGFKLNGTDCYYYLYNLQGDVTGIYDSDGVVVAKYYYDAWGNTTEMDGSGNSVYDENHVARLNPIRYRSYYYDSEILMYYLQSRYYMPWLCRFISADAYFVAGNEITGTNMYAYCGNNPVNYSDPTGCTNEQTINGESNFNLTNLILLGVGLVFIVILITGVNVVVSLGEAIATVASNAAYAVSEAVKYAAVSLADAVIAAINYSESQINENDYNYFRAKYIELDSDHRTYVPGDVLTKKQALDHVRRGGNVFAASQHLAYELAYEIENLPPTTPEQHKNRKTNDYIGQLYHYHSHSRKGGHIFYL